MPTGMAPSPICVDRIAIASADTMSHQQSTMSCTSLKRFNSKAVASPRRSHQARPPTGRTSSMKSP